MNKISKKFTTKYTADEMKNWISVKLLSNDLVRQITTKTEWREYSFYLESSIGKGYIHLRDYEIEIDIELSIFGSMMSRTLEDTFEKEFKKLEHKEK